MLKNIKSNFTSKQTNQRVIKLGNEQKNGIAWINPSKDGTKNMWIAKSSSFIFYYILWCWCCDEGFLQGNYAWRMANEIKRHYKNMRVTKLHVFVGWCVCVCRKLSRIKKKNFIYPINGECFYEFSFYCLPLLGLFNVLTLGKCHSNYTWLSYYAIVTHLFFLHFLMLLYYECMKQF